MNPSLLAISAVPPPGYGSTNDIRAIKPPVAIPDFWIWVWWGLGLASVAALVYLWWRRRRQLAQAAERVVILPPHLRARQKLHDALGLINQPKPFIVAISDVLRLYLEERFDFHAPERTTEEFLFELQATPLLTPKQKEGLADFLQQCDLVKFARYEPVLPELRELYNAAVRLVEETVPLPPAPVNAPETELVAQAEEAAR